MDPLDATNVLFAKIKSLDPENASKIMGYILIQDVQDKDLLRLALSPDAVLQSFVATAKANLRLSSNTFSAHSSAPSSPSPLNPISRPAAQNPFSQLSPRLSGNALFNGSPKSSPLLSYENIRSGTFLGPPFSNLKHASGVADGDFLDQQQMDDYLSFMNDSSVKGEEFPDTGAQLGFPAGNDIHSHRRSFSESDASFFAEDKPCLYFARGCCKNGDNCKFSHVSSSGDGMENNGVALDSPSQMEMLYHQQEEMMRMRAAHQHRLPAAQFMPGHSSFPFDKSMNRLLQNDSQRAAALMLGEEISKFGRYRPERNDFLAMGFAEKGNSALRQIYLTFPADSTFKDEDVSSYFSMFGPVQDVRIPHQQKRMFGFVTFVHPETVKLIFARGNPHFICDSRVLVKPYKEKGKIPEKRHLQQQFERGNFSPSRDLCDLHLGGNMFFNAHELMLRKKLEEQADLQQAIEVQRRRFLNLQLPNFKNNTDHFHQRSLSVGASISLPSYVHGDQNNFLPSHAVDEECSEAILPSDLGTQEELQNKGTCTQDGSGGSSKVFSNAESCESGLEHALPDNLFASPERSSEGNQLDSLTPANGDESGTYASSANDPTLCTSGGETASL